MDASKGFQFTLADDCITVTCLTGPDGRTTSVSANDGEADEHLPSGVKFDDLLDKTEEEVAALFGMQVKDGAGAVAGDAELVQDIADALELTENTTFLTDFVVNAHDVLTAMENVECALNLLNDLLLWSLPKKLPYAQDDQQFRRFTAVDHVVLIALARHIVHDLQYLSAESIARDTGLSVPKVEPVLAKLSTFTDVLLVIDHEVQQVTGTPYVINVDGKWRTQLAQDEQARTRILARKIVDADTDDK
jgi:hypothetical protein